MTKRSASAQTDSISDAAVRAKTGKSWKQWFALLDKAGARRWEHKDIAAHLHKKLDCPGWWNQMVAVAYERARGLRQKHQRPDGFSVSRSATVAAPLGRLFDAWQDARTRRRWLADPEFLLRKATANKSMRITWVDGKTSVEANFYAKGAGKSQITVQHNKLADAKAVERMRSYWGGALGKLKTILEA